MLSHGFIPVFFFFQTEDGKRDQPRSPGLGEVYKRQPIDKVQLSKAILANNSNLQKIIKIVHKEIRKKLLSFLNKNKNKRFVILDIPLLLENKINKKKDILVYVDSRKTDILRNLKKRKNFNPQILNKFKRIQLSLAYKKKISKFIIKNNFKKKSVIDEVGNILKKIKNERNSP